MMEEKTEPGTSRLGSTEFWYKLAQRLIDAVDRIPVKWILIGCIVVGIPMRISGLDYALPTISYKESLILERVWEAAASLDLNPQYFDMPGLEFYLNYFLLNLMNAFGSVDWGDFVITVRIMQALMGVMAIPLIYLIAAKLYDRRAGLIAAVIFTFLPAHVFYSHMARPDVMAMTFIMAVIYFSIKMLETMQLRYYILSGIFCGLAVSAQYFGIISLILPFVAHFLFMNNVRAAYKDVRAIYLLVLVVMAALVFLYTNPYAILDPTAFAADFESHWQDIVWWTRITQPDPWENFNYYFSKTLSDIGLPMFILFLGGFGYAVWRHNRYDVLLIISSLLFVVFFRFYGEPTMRFMIPLLSLLVVMSSGMLVMAAGRIVRIEHITRRQVGVILLAVSPLILLVVPFGDIISQNGNLKLTSISEVATDWTLENISPGSRIYRSSNTPALDYLEYDGEKIYDVVSGKGPSWDYDDDYEAFIYADFEYVVLTNSHEKYRNRLQQYPVKSVFYEQFYEDYEMIMEFRTNKGEYGASVIEYTKVTNRLLVFKRSQ